MSMRSVRKGNHNLDSDVTPALGKTIQRLRKAYKLSLGELSEQSGVAKSIISQIERNETNPTIGTVERLSRALDTTIGEVLKSDAGENFFEHQGRSGIPKLESEDGLCTLAIIGALDLVEYVQWYDFHARPGGILESEPHQAGCVEHLFIIEGELEITVGGEVRRVTAGQSIRYAGDRPHSIRNAGQQDAHATMVLVMRAP
ncbi:MAG: helix-turn-helix transcriptional regulator [Rhizobiales bacterium]|nr:helix-turn-helix transcriptional regulator [Hyphomicrobiales bacterium]